LADSIDLNSGIATLTRNCGCDRASNDSVTLGKPKRGRGEQRKKRSRSGLRLN